MVRASAAVAWLSTPLGDQKPHGPGVPFRIADEIRQALWIEIRDSALLTNGKLVARLLWKNGVEIIAVAAIKNIDAGREMRLALDQKTDGLIDQRKFHEDRIQWNAHRAMNVMAHRAIEGSIPGMDKEEVLPDGASLMPNPKKRGLSDALSRDLRKPGSKELVKVLDDVARKVFTAHKDGAVFEFGHKQPDPAFWKGVKHYGSGPSSRVRFRRTPSPAAE